MADIADGIVNPIAKAVGEIGRWIATAAGPLHQEARALILSYLDGQKQRAAQEVSALAGLVRRSVPGDDPSTAAMTGCAQQLADRIDEFATTLRDRPMDAILADAEKRAQRQPAVFLAGAVAIGFMLGLVLTADGGGNQDAAQRPEP